MRPFGRRVADALRRRAAEMGRTAREIDDAHLRVHQSGDELQELADDARLIREESDRMAERVREVPPPSTTRGE